MVICAAQIRSGKGDIEQNTSQHLRWIEKAVAGRADIVVFPELSLTGYEPSIANGMALDTTDSRLDIFQASSDAGNIVIAVGLPVKAVVGTCISLVIFQPGTQRRVYTKEYLHADEHAFFTPGNGGPVFCVNDEVIAFAICYELSVSEHAAKAAQQAANIYIASVAKSAMGMEKAMQSLSAIATLYQMKVLVSNCIGYCDNFESAGGSAAWNQDGKLLATLGDNSEGLLFFDTVKGQTFIEPGRS